MPFDTPLLATYDQPYDPIIQKLEDGKQVILKQGWCQFIRSDEKNQVCLLGAYTGWNGMLAAPEIDRKAIEVIRAEIPPLEDPKADKASPWYRIAKWNNDDGRTKEEVLALIDRAIATQRAKGLAA